MLLVIDVGNTNITLGTFKGDSLCDCFRMTTKMNRTSDEFGIFICNLFKTKGIEIADIEGVIIASVVPKVMYSLTSGIKKYLGKTPVIVGTGTKTGLKIRIPNPKEMGADRVVDGVAAYEQYGGPVLVIDFGTATTYDLILEDGSLVAGITSPGIQICASALWNETARLPEIEIKKPDSILAKDTITSMQAGLVYGCIGQTEYIINQVKKEAGLSDMKVVATGGLGKIIAASTELIDVYDPLLTLQGLRLIYNKCKKQQG